jgi:hypothetical protein
MTEKIYLSIPFELKDELKKAYTIKWDAKKKSWFSDKMEEGLNKYKTVPIDIEYDDKDHYKSLLKSMKWDASNKTWTCSIEDSLKVN